MFDYIAVGVAHNYVGESGGMLPQKCLALRVNLVLAIGTPKGDSHQSSNMQANIVNEKHLESA